MDVNLTTLNTKGRVNFDIKPKLGKYYEKNKVVKSLNDVDASGYIIDNGTDEYEIYLKITGNLILRSAINGQDVAKKLNIEYNDFVPNLVENYKNSSNTLDISPIIWENILLEIPIKAENPDDKYDATKGDGWEVVND